MVNPSPPVHRKHVGGTAASVPPPSSISPPSAPRIVRPTAATTTTTTKTTQQPPPPSSASVTSSSSPFPPPNNNAVGYIPPSALDEIMNELDDLLQAASESQALGRLRNSYSSLLLAHQRLVGLGRRVDRSYCEAERNCVDREQQQHENNIDRGGGVEGSHPGESNMTSMSTMTTTFLPPLVNQPPLPLTLTQHGEYADVAYVEHLARSAMELHHRRTGRGMQHEMAIERAAYAAKTKKMEDEQIQQAAQGVFALSAVLPGGGGEGVSTTTSSIPATSSGGKKKRKGSTDGGEGVSWEEYTDGNNDGPDTPGTPSKRKGGRGKKPPTLVMQTMAGRNLDVRELMKGIL